MRSAWVLEPKSRFCHQDISSDDTNIVMTHDVHVRSETCKQGDSCPGADLRCRNPCISATPLPRRGTCGPCRKRPSFAGHSLLWKIKSTIKGSEPKLKHDMNVKYQESRAKCKGIPAVLYAASKYLPNLNSSFESSSIIYNRTSSQFLFS